MRAGPHRLHPSAHKTRAGYPGPGAAARLTSLRFRLRAKRYGETSTKLEERSRALAAAAGAATERPNAERPSHRTTERPSVRRSYVAGVAVALLIAVPAHAQQEEERARQVYQLFKTYCFECHGETEKGGLDLRTQETLLKGGESGPAIVAHEPEKSRLYLLVAHRDEPPMPRKKPQLSAEAIELIRQWIEDGGSLDGVEDAVPDSTKSPEVLAKAEERPITDEERQYWAFQRPRRAAIPQVSRPAWQRNPIDAFLLSAMSVKGVTPAPKADRRTLIRRACLDVLGLPPSPEEVDAFVNDKSPDAWPKLVDRLLASPHYGERWARHWLDLVRYADSGGFEFDVDRPEGWRYRDYVVKAFNEDKSYAQFVREQIAGDEYRPISDDAMIATGFLRLGPEGGGGERGRQEALDDLVATTSLTFLGLTVNCARCHNHKFDPIPQKDYYRIQAVFFNTRGIDYPLVPAHDVEAQKAAVAKIDQQQRPLRQAKRELEAPYLKQLVDQEIERLPEYLQMAWKTPEAQRTEGQKLNVAQIEKTLQNDSLRAKITDANLVPMMTPAEREKHRALVEQIAALEKQKPKALPNARAIAENGREPRPSYFLHRGSLEAKGSVMTPGTLTVATLTPYEFTPPPADATSTWRRRGFAEWLVSPDNPLTARVMLNRLWQHHFGEGIVHTPSNFGKMGERPSNAELLDWLALEFVERGWSLKAMHRLMMTSEAYQMQSRDVAANVAIDPENRLFWRMPRERLEAEAIRDEVLAVAGTLDRTLGGPNVFPYIDPDLFEKSSKRDWPGKPDDDPSTWRRSLYVFSKRSIRYPLFEAFDQPNLINSTDRRNRSIVAPQALLLMNNNFMLVQAKKFAERLRKEAGNDPRAQVDRAFQLALGRPPDGGERGQAIEFVRAGAQGLEEFCHLMFNLNEFVYRQ
jgi:mono/diheme cytochrome c family protein